ncbi:MAG: helix-turn-helix domain-containing protein [Candidatus Binatia bacterium]
MRIRTSPRAAWMEYDGCIVAPEQSHEFDAGGHAVALFYVEPEGADGRRVAAAAGRRGVAILDANVVGRVRAVLSAGASDDLLDTAFSALGFDSGARPVEARIRRALLMLKKSRFEYPTSAALASGLGLSPGRFRHLWLSELGLAYRRYLLWLRLQAAITATMRGRSLTEAAHEAGFADSAHLARTFRRLLGIAPSAMPVVSSRSR